MTMGDWIQGARLLDYACFRLLWTDTLPECHCFDPFLEAGPSLPWRVGGCHGQLGACREVDLSPTVHI